jgi:uroporphyrin-III C-methyltransferase/precorrin-2 dehydrogenase/sirohydrochlorin ferrochelatase
LTLTGRGHARRLQYVTGHARDGRMPEDIDWKALADAATTTAIYMPTRTLADLVGKALVEGLDPATPAIAVARATRPDQQALHAPIGELPRKLAAAELPGPVLVMLGKTIARADAGAVRAARQKRG